MSTDNRLELAAREPIQTISKTDRGSSGGARILEHLGPAAGPRVVSQRQLGFLYKFCFNQFTLIWWKLQIANLKLTAESNFKGLSRRGFFNQ